MYARVEKAIHDGLIKKKEQEHKWLFAPCSVKCWIEDFWLRHINGRKHNEIVGEQQQQQAITTPNAQPPPKISDPKKQTL